MFGFGDPSLTDPFLMMDDFRNDRPQDYLKGFPWHPHRGIETITYVLAGTVEHGDLLGNVGNLGAGDVQWMTAGSGIMHQEMPKGDVFGRMHGFQLWANLPSNLKMTSPRYQDVKSNEIPEIIDDDGTKVRVIVGEFWGKKGPVDGIAADPQYLDIYVPPVSAKCSRLILTSQPSLTFSKARQRSAMLQSRLVCWSKRKSTAKKSTCATCRATARLWCLIPVTKLSSRPAKKACASCLVSGAPIKEPVAWHGPIVMNTREELITAVNELRSGTFIKEGVRAG